MEKFFGLGQRMTIDQHTSPVSSFVFDSDQPNRKVFRLQGVVQRGIINNDQSITLPSGEIINTDNTITNTDGSITRTTYRTETRFEYPDGTTVLRNGLIIFRDGSIITSTLQSDDSWLLPDGSRVNPDGRREFPDGEIQQGLTKTERLIVFEDGRLVLPDGRIVSTVQAPNQEGFTIPGSAIQGQVFPSGNVQIPEGEVSFNNLELRLPNGNTRRFTLQEEHIFVFPDGTIVFRSDGTTVNPDGTVTRSTLNPDGSITLPDGTQITPNRQVIFPDGRIGTTTTRTERIASIPGGRLVFPDGTTLTRPYTLTPGINFIGRTYRGEFDSDGTLVLPSGERVRFDGTFQLPNGESRPIPIQTESSIVLSDNRIVFPNGVTIRPDGYIVQGRVDTSGRIMLPDRTVVYPSGSYILPFKQPSQGVILQEDVAVLPDGRFVLADGTVVPLPIGSVRDKFATGDFAPQDSSEVAVFILGKVDNISPADTDGNMILPNGEGRVSFNEREFIMRNGNRVPIRVDPIDFVTLPDGRRVILSNGFVLNPDGTVRAGTPQANGNIILLDGTIIYPDGNFILPNNQGRGRAEMTRTAVGMLPNGKFVLATGDLLTTSKIPAIGRITNDGRIIFPNDMIVYPDGSVDIGSQTIQTTVMENYFLLPDGRIILKDGRIFTNLGREQFDTATSTGTGSGQSSSQANAVSRFRGRVGGSLLRVNYNKKLPLNIFSLSKGIIKGLVPQAVDTEIKVTSVNGRRVSFTKLFSVITDSPLAPGTTGTGDNEPGPESRVAFATSIVAPEGRGNYVWRTLQAISYEDNLVDIMIEGGATFSLPLSVKDPSTGNVETMHIPFLLGFETRAFMERLLNEADSTQQFILSLVTNYDGHLQSFSANNELFSIPFQIFYVNGKNILTLVMSSCTAIKDFGADTDGYYLIDPDGPNVGAKPFVTLCHMEQGLTIVEHSANDRTLVTDFFGNGQFITNISYYNTALDQMEALTAVSTDCYQYLKYECNGASLFFGDQPLAFWESRGRQYMDSWGGVPIGLPGCKCSLNQGCKSAEDVCNCVADNSNGIDDGVLTDRQFLPVTGIRSDDVGNGKTGHFSLGPLKCLGDTSYQHQKSIEFVKQLQGVVLKSCAEYKAANLLKTDSDSLRLIDPDGEGILAPFTVQCSPAGDTIVHHDLEEKVIVQPTDQGFRKTVNYLADPEHIRKLKMISENCVQHVSLTCQKTPFWIGDVQNVWWTSLDGVKMDYWGNVPSTEKGCACGLNKDCYGGGSTRCNCDADTSFTLSDGGNMNKKQDLPVSSIEFSRVGETSDFSIGPLVCTGIRDVPKEDLDVPILATCEQLKQSGQTHSGTYFIDPDGPNNGVEPFEVYCNMDSGVTVVTPQDADSQLIAGHEDPGSSQHRIEYGDPEISIPQLAALVAKSGSCSQTIKYECFGSVLFDPDEDHKPYAWWMNKYGQQRYAWTDHLDPTQSGCYCGVTKSCANGQAKCNCDNNDQVWRSDEGVITNKGDLPIRAVNFGDISSDLGKEMGRYTVGALKCQGQSDSAQTEDSTVPAVFETDGVDGYFYDFIIPENTYSVEFSVRAFSDACISLSPSRNGGGTMYEICIGETPTNGRNTPQTRLSRSANGQPLALHPTPNILNPNRETLFYVTFKNQIIRMTTITGEEIFKHTDAGPSFDLKFLGFKTKRGYPGSWRFHSFYTKDKIVCENKESKLSCPDGKFLDIHAANFGRTSTRECPSTTDRALNQNTRCFSDIAFTKVVQDCQAKTSCTLRPIKGLYGDPCPDTDKYLHVKYSCSDFPVTKSDSLGVCSSQPCQNNGICKSTGDGYVCQCTGPYTGANCDKRTLTCVAHGDVNFETFDGRRYAFQGSCTYVMTKICSSDEFQVLVRHVHQPDAPFMRGVIVIIGSHVILMEPNKNPQAATFSHNGLAISPTYVQENGLFSIETHGAYYILHFPSAGLKVEWDGKQHISVTMELATSGEHCGLCGNMDRNRHNDLLTRQGIQVSDPVEFADSWRTDPSCPECGEECRNMQNPCDSGSAATDRPQAEDRCSIILSEQGPFASCHTKVDPNHYFQECVNDQCRTGNSATLCSIISEYAAACLNYQIVIFGWRDITSCPYPSCDNTMMYKECSLACPPTCAKKDINPHCRQSCREGCECRNGYVLDGYTCVAPENCGCKYEGANLKIGGEMVIGSCTERVMCKVGGIIEKVPIQCGPDFNSFCGQGGDDQTFGCHCISGYSRNDQGQCTPGVNRRQARSVAAVTHRLSARQAQAGIVGHFTDIDRPYYDADYTTVINVEQTIYEAGYISSWTYRASTLHPFKACAWRLMKEDTYKLIGCNLIQPQTVNVKAVENIFEGFKIPVRKGDMIGFTFFERSPIAYSLFVQGSNEFVRVHNQLDGNFATLQPGDCLEITQNAGRRAYSIFASVQSSNNQALPSIACSAWLGLSDGTIHNGAMSASCAANGRGPELARLDPRDDRTWISSKNEEGQWVQVDFPEEETITGIIMQGDIETNSWVSRFTVQYTLDGITFEDILLPDDYRQSFIGNSDASRLEYIFFDNEIKALQLRILPVEWNNNIALSFEVIGCKDINPCVNNPCEHGGECFLANNVDGYSCSCIAGRAGKHCGKVLATCEVASGPHYITFDGSAYDFAGECEFILSKNVNDDIPNYKVAIVNVAKDNVTIAPERRDVYIDLPGARVDLQDGEVILDGKRVALPVKTDAVHIYQSGFGVVVSSSIGLRVRWNRRKRISLEVPPSFHDSVGGLCGNYNGDLNDDFKTPNGTLKDLVSTFGLSWAVDPSACSFCSKCMKTCDDPEKRAHAECLCQVLVDNRGPFSGCNRIMNPQWFFDNCMSDLCADFPNTDHFCDTVDDLAARCALIGKPAENWRHDVPKCAMKCPPGLIYNACASPCTDTCGNPFASKMCEVKGFVEGCVCAEGLVLQNGMCVKPKQCGATFQGQYHLPNAKFINDQCSEQCVSLPGGFTSCRTYACDRKAQCGIQDGYFGCHCQEGNFGDGQKCTEVTGETREVHLCEGETFSLGCANRYITIIDAYYGRTAKSTKCATDKKLFPGQVCRSDVALYMTSLKCQGRSSCEFNVSSEIFGDPCLDITKELIVHYKCTEEESGPTYDRDYLVEFYQENDLNLDCGSQFLTIKSTHYGRDSCTSETAFGIVLRECQGKNSCNVKIDEKLFGNPCPEEIKKMTVTFECTEEQLTLEEVCSTHPCMESPCENGGTCIASSNVDGFICKCAKGFTDKKCQLEEGVCRFSGAFKVESFDCAFFHVYGDCVYTAVKNCNPDGPQFEVLVHGEKFSKDLNTTWVQAVTLKALGKELTLRQNKKIRLNGRNVFSPLSLDDGALSISRAGKYLILNTNFGLTLKWNGHHGLQIYLAFTDLIRPCGLCGNFNKDLKDDFFRRGDLGACNLPQFIQSWVSETDNCEVCKTCQKEDPCSENKRNAQVAENSCSIIDDENGPLHACHQVVDPKPFKKACMKDICLTLPSKELVCHMIAEYVDRCLEAGGEPGHWRTRMFCPMQCPAGQRYTMCMSGCEDECGNLNAKASCPDRCYEGCECTQPDHVKQGDQCVHRKACGCTENGLYYPVEYGFVRESCTGRCECLPGGELCCMPFACGVHAQCHVRDGESSCYCDKGYGGNGVICQEIQHPLHALVSAGQTIYMDCGDLYIQVQSAVFGGLQSTGVCTALQYPDQECPDSVDAENQLLPFCEGKHFCSVPAIPRRFGDICQHKFKYLQVQFACQWRPSERDLFGDITITTCQNEYMEINCRHQYIHILAVTFGRTAGAEVCPHTKVRDQDCRAVNAPMLCKLKCQGKHQCEMRATKEEFGGEDPCPKTYKYLEVTYRCTQTPVLH